MQAFWQSPPPAAGRSAAPPPALLDELVQAVARGAGLSGEQSAAAVSATLRFFTARLPSSLVGELHARLGGGAPPDDPARDA